MLLYTLVVLLLTAASRHIDTNLLTAITNVFSVLIPLIAAAHLIHRKTFVNFKFGVIMAAAAGLTIGLYGMALSKSFSVNKIGIVTPVVFGGTIFLSTFLSYFIFKEKVTLLQTCGLVVLAIGFSIIIFARATGR